MTGTSLAQHRVDVGDGVVLHVLERRAAPTCEGSILMIPATLTTNRLYDADVDGDASYNVLRQAAQLGLAAYAVSYEGYGESTPAEDGAAVTFARCLTQLRVLVEWIAERDGIERVDVLGASVGSDLAVALGSDLDGGAPERIGRVILTSTVFASFSELVAREAFTPAFEAQLRGIPGGRLPTQAPFYDLVLTAVDDPVRRWAARTFPGTYATGPTLAAFDKPLFDPTRTRAPALVFWGEADPVTPRADIDALVDAHAATIRRVDLPGGGHSPFLEPRRDVFWSETRRFLTGE